MNHFDLQDPQQNLPLKKKKGSSKKKNDRLKGKPFAFVEHTTDYPRNRYIDDEQVDDDIIILTPSNSPPQAKTNSKDEQE